MRQKELTAFTFLSGPIIPSLIFILAMPATKLYANDTSAIAKDSSEQLKQQINAVNQLNAAQPLDTTTRQQLLQQASEQSESFRQFEKLQQTRQELDNQKQTKAPDIKVDSAKLAQTALPAASATQPETAASEKPCFLIQSVELNGDEDHRFYSLLRSLQVGPQAIIGQCLGVNGVNEAATRVQNKFIKKGYVTTRVLVPSQNLSSGKLILQLIPGRVGKITRVNAKPFAYSIFNTVPLNSGDLLNVRAIEQGLENFKRLPSVEADLKLAPSTTMLQPGYSDILINWQQQKPWKLSSSVDNSGSKYTGIYQGNLTFAVDNALRANDLFYIGLNHDLGGGLPGRRGTHGYVGSYTLPLGYWLLTTSYSDSNYNQNVAGLSQDYLYSGSSRNISAKLTKIIYRDNKRKTALIGGGNYRSSHNFINDVEIQVQHRRNAGVEVGINHREFIGKGTLDATFTFHHGTGAFNALPAPEEMFNEGSNRVAYSKALVYYNQPFTFMQRPFAWNTEWRAQFSTSALIPQDRFAIGSRYTVRGFDGEQMLMGDRGYIIRNDLSTPVFSQKANAYIGIDYGHVGGQSTVTPYPQLGNHLVGSAIGVKGKLPKGFAYDVFVGAPLWKPDYFQSKKGVFGFALFWSY